MKEQRNCFNCDKPAERYSTRVIKHSPKPYRWKAAITFYICDDCVDNLKFDDKLLRILNRGDKKAI